MVGTTTEFSQVSTLLTQLKSASPIESAVIASKISKTLNEIAQKQAAAQVTITPQKPAQLSELENLYQNASEEATTSINARIAQAIEDIKKYSEQK